MQVCTSSRLHWACLETLCHLVGATQPCHACCPAILIIVTGVLMGLAASKDRTDLIVLKPYRLSIDTSSGKEHSPGKNA